MDTIIDTDKNLQASNELAATWREWKPEPQPQTERIPEPYHSLNPKRGFANAPEPITIKGVSETALSKELANMHPAYREEHLSRMSTKNPQYPLTLIEREGSFTTIEREASGRVSRNIFQPIKPTVSTSQKKSTTTITTGSTSRKQPSPIGYIIPTPGISTGRNQRRQQITTYSPTSDITEKITPTSRTDISIIPYQITTPTESKTTTTVPEVTPTPWEKITPYEQPIKTVTPLPPVPVIPIVPVPIPGIPWGSGGGGGSGGSPIGRGRLKRELFSYAPKNLKLLYGKMPTVKKPRGKK
jgi:hypothetical protein